MKRTKHSLSHYKLLTAKMGGLYPIACMETLPNDTFQHQTSTLIRLSPQVKPVMHPVQVRIHHFQIPWRILVPEFTEFITGGSDGFDDTILPTYTTDGTEAGTLWDYLGIPAVAGVTVSAAPLMAFNKVFNEYYRDQDLVAERDLMDSSIPNVAWERDYFTVARPWTQKGPDITIPIAGNAPVLKQGDQVQFQAGLGGPNTNVQTDAAGNLTLFGSPNVPAGWPQDGTYYADMAAVTGISANQLRELLGLQRYEENRAMYGSRYTEYLAMCGVRSSDARLQRPEYLGGGKQTIQFSEVLNTASNAEGGTPTLDPLGALGGHGIAALRSNRYRRYIEEHGFIMSFMSVRPKSIYMDNIHRKFLRTTKEQYYQKELELIGQEEIFKNEVYADAATGMETFGFGDRYRSYREEPSTVHGEFRTTEKDWHLARDFEGVPPVLNSTFVTCNPSDRIFADQTGNDTLYCMVNHSVQARRNVGKKRTPRII